MHIVTGGAGFIGSAMISRLNQAGIDDIVVVDNLGESSKWKNLVSLKFKDFVHKSQFLNMLYRDKFSPVESIIHMGACSSTTEQNADYLMENNFFFSKQVALYGLSHDARVIIASSASTYGNGERGFSDEINLHALKPLNMYGYSKHLFDQWAYREKSLNRLVALKFFNVFGPNEYHKKDQASMVFKAFHQAKSKGCIRLFKSYHPLFGDGEQKRDFVYVKDCTDVMMWFIENPNKNGLFNVGSGTARTWNDLATAVFTATKQPPLIEYIDMPPNIKDHYQYFTESKIDRLRAIGYRKPFQTLEDSVSDYIENYLSKDMSHL